MNALVHKIGTVPQTVKQHLSSTFKEVQSGDKTALFILVSGLIVMILGAFILFAATDNGSQLAPYQEKFINKQVEDTLNLSAAGEFDQAETQVVEAINKERNPEVRRALRMHLAMLYQEHGNLEAALAALEASIREDGPVSVVLADSIAQLYEQQDNYVAAGDYYEQAYRLYATKPIDQQNEDTADYYLQKTRFTKERAQ